MAVPRRRGVRVSHGDVGVDGDASGRAGEWGSRDDWVGAADTEAVLAVRPAPNQPPPLLRPDDRIATTEQNRVTEMKLRGYSRPELDDVPVAQRRRPSLAHVLRQVRQRLPPVRRRRVPPGGAEQVRAVGAFGDRDGEGQPVHRRPRRHPWAVGAP